VYLGTCLITLMLFCKKNLNARKPLVSGVKPKGRSFACKHLRKVKIKCSKDDVRVHKLAHLFRANGVPDENIFVCRTGSTCESYLLFIMYLILYSLRPKISDVLGLSYVDQTISSLTKFIGKIINIYETK